MSRKSKVKKKPSAKKWIWTSVIAVFAIILILVGLYTIDIVNGLKGMNKADGESIFKNAPKPAEEVGPPKWEGTERVNVLLLGGDSRGLSKNEVPRSDSMLVASVDPVTKKAQLLSVLRDTYVSIPGHGKDRINAALALGGPDLAMKTVSDLLGVPVQYYVYVDFKGFIALIDAIGGIDFEVEKNMRYTSKADKHEYDINLKKGMQHLDGNAALQYVRFRHDAMSDFARSERQREFLKAVADKMLSTWSIIKLPDILKEVNPYIETNMTLDDMWKLAGVGYDSKFVASEQIPPMNMISDMKVGGASVLAVRDEDKLKEYVQELFAKADEPASNTDAETVGADGGDGSNASKDSDGGTAGGRR
ncbi:Polyisoprenyl-teichoic acid--peptidoglycan teichoic acid transferase TagU [Paenibacillus sp. CECT 9249]|uniref:LCP family protein n=1 Tax=Paenibacillus sp. CECT 9249 TaxID=2845385 RepID=UPI001E444BDA|nr:LCP family protein [Paenibacillus sp. CECT 9249]CAH0118841.1 Polyisoprenyl-teichoic acid--peptidoglycan teichoic acid transferase TagU [Paenibacillus sp. CECT 9249]